jgi:hypothetical protein
VKWQEKAIFIVVYVNFQIKFFTELDVRVIVNEDNARPLTARVVLGFLKQKGMKKHPTHHTHLI